MEFVRETPKEKESNRAMCKRNIPNLKKKKKEKSTVYVKQTPHRKMKPAWDV